MIKLRAEKKMRNLRNILHVKWEPPAQFQGRHLTSSTWDLASDCVLCTFGPTETDALIELVRIKIKQNTQYVSSSPSKKIYLSPLVSIQSSHLGTHPAQIQSFHVTRF